MMRASDSCRLRAKPYTTICTGRGSVGVRVPHAFYASCPFRVRRLSKDKASKMCVCVCGRLGRTVKAKLGSGGNPHMPCHLLFPGSSWCCRSGLTFTSKSRDAAARRGPLPSGVLIWGATGHSPNLLSHGALSLCTFQQSIPRPSTYITSSGVVSTPLLACST